MTNCFSKIALVIIRENKTETKISNRSGRHFENSGHCYNHLAVIIARENKVLNQLARAIFDNHRCNNTNMV